MEPEIGQHARVMIEARLRVGTPKGLGADDCWPWRGRSKGRDGRGLIQYTENGRRRTITVNRAICALRGELPFHGAAHSGRHSCDNPPCCNPAHVVAGTAKDNARDTVERGRRAKEHRAHTRLRMLTDETVRAIRASVGRPLAEVAGDFGIAMSTVSKIRNGKAKAGVL